LVIYLSGKGRVSTIYLKILVTNHQSKNKNKKQNGVWEGKQKQKKQEGRKICKQTNFTSM